jgi:hypothetical protein
MKYSLKTAIVRVLTDLIKADAIIDAGEMEKYSILKTKYCLTSDDELDGSQMTLAESMNVISDGFRAPSEALLMIALIRILEKNAYSGRFLFTNSGDIRSLIGNLTGIAGTRARDYSSQSYNYGSGRTIQTCSRGGQYYINSNGNKTYIPKRQY